jgi:hypothetical protein
MSGTTFVSRNTLRRASRLKKMMSQKNLNSRCNGRAKSGKPCRAAATPGGLCFFHANPKKASELGRIGGRTNRHAAAESADSLPTLDNAMAVRDTVARLIADVYAGKIHPRIASGLALLLNLQMRAIETTNLERRLAKLEKLSAEAEDRPEPTASATQRISDLIERARQRVTVEQSRALAGVSSSSNQPSDT